MASLHKDPRGRSPFFYAKFRDSGGRVVFRSTKQKERKKAWEVCLGWVNAVDSARQGALTEVQARRVISQILERTTGQPLNFVTAEGFFATWVASKKITKAKGTSVRYGVILENFLAHIGSERAKLNVAAIGPAEIQSFRDSEITAGKSESTANFSLKTLRTVFGAARRQGYISHNPADAIDSFSAVKEEREPFTVEQVRLLIAATKGTEWEGMILLGFYTGARLSDCAQMTWDNIELGERLVRFVPGKTARAKPREEVRVEMAPDLETYFLDRGSSDKPATKLFPALARKKGTGANGLSNSFGRIILNAGIEVELGAKKEGKGRQFRKLGFHSLRHTCNSIMANADVPIEIRRAIMGHASDEMNARYTHHQRERLRTAIAVLPSLRASQVSGS